jgi:hypothetical protein
VFKNSSIMHSSRVLRKVVFRVIQLPVFMYTSDRECVSFTRCDVALVADEVLE